MLFTPQEIYDKYRLDENHDMHEYSPFLREIAHGNILEIGVRGGVSTAAFLCGLEKNGGHLWSVDQVAHCGWLFAGHPQWTFTHGDSHDSAIVDQFYKLKEGPKCMTFDIVFIDGDHSRTGVWKDLQYFGALLSPKGMLLAHDVDVSVPFEDTPDFPTIAVREEFEAYVKSCGWKSRIMPGKFGLGVAICE